MTRKVGYTWRLREVMAQRRVFTATELVPLLRERGVDLSASQVHRLVSGTPERLSLQVLSALCDILSCTPADLVAATAEDAASARPAPATCPPRPRAPRSCGPARPGSCPANEPSLRDRRAVRTLVPGRVLPLRPPQEQGRQLAGRARLPDLRGPRRANTGNLPRLRSGAGASRSAARRRCRDLRRLRRVLAVLRLRALRFRGQAAWRPACPAPAAPSPTGSLISWTTAAAGSAPSSSRWPTACLPWTTRCPD